MKSMVKIQGDWFHLVEIGKKSITVLLGGSRLWIVSKKLVDGFKLA